MNRHLLFLAFGRMAILLALVLVGCTPLPTALPPTATQPPSAQAPTETVPPVSPTPAPASTDTAAPETPTATTPTPTDTPAPVPSTDTPEASTEPTQPVKVNSNFGLICVRNPEIPLDQKLETTPFFVKGQVILTGPADRMDKVVAALAEKDIRLTPIYRCTLGIPQQLPKVNQGPASFKKDSRRGGKHAAFPFSPKGNSGPNVPGGLGLAMNLYQLDDPRVSRLLTLFDQLNALQAGLEPQEKVYADANYLTGHLSSNTCGNPFGVEGSPFGVEGSPFGVEGSPFGVEGSPLGGAGGATTEADFWNQWAFKRIGLDKPGQRKFTETGQGVRVAVFDTSPYAQKVGDPPLSVTETAITPALNLTVHYPYELQNLPVTGSVSQTTPPDDSDHGLFVASLIHALAVDSQIDLYRVLDSAGCGDVYHLNMAVLDFLARQWLETSTLPKPAVINLSLGVRKPSDVPSDQADVVQNMNPDVQASYQLAALDPSIESLEIGLQLSDLSGMVIVAAAGNNSVPNNPPVYNPPQHNMPLAMDLPADYSFVIGVSATNPQDAPSCFSNLGDVGAPGGDAQLNTQPTPACVSMIQTCPTQWSNSPGDCPWGVIGLSKKPNSSFAFWTGTSFATPLVSGLAALLYQHTGRQGDVAVRVINQVNPIGNASYGRGVIQVIKALTP